MGSHFDHRQAVNGQFLVNLSRWAGQGGLAAVGVDEEGRELFVGGGFVVHGQQGAVHAVGRGLAVGVQAKPLHAVVVVTGAAVKVGVGAVVLEGGRAGGEWVAQGVQHLEFVAGGHAHLVGQAFGHGGEAQLVHGIGQGGGARTSASCRCSATCERGTTQHGGGGHARTAQQHLAAAQAGAQYCVEMRVGRGVGVFVVEEVGSAWRVLCHGERLA